MSLSRSIAAVAVAAMIAGCGSDPIGPNNERVILANPSFATNINEIIQRRGCSAGSCHGAPAGQAGMRLTADAANNYAQWVNVPATSESFLRIFPNNPDSSYVMIKVEGRQMVGAQMPFGGAPLDSIDLTNLRNWINNGAPNN